MTFSCSELLVFILAINSIRSEPTCHCVKSTSIYLTTTIKPVVTTEATTRETTVTGDPPAKLIGINTTSGLGLVTTSASFNKSSPGYKGNYTTNMFTIPAGVTDPMITLDLLIGPTGTICRPMPYIDQICVSSNCDGCNLNSFTVAPATSTDAESALSNRIFYPSPLVNATACADRKDLELFGDFRYIVFIPLGSPSPGQPYAFRIGISGSFSAFNCQLRGRRSAEATSNIQARVSEKHMQSLPRLRRAAPNNCSCPLGEDPVFSSTATVLISWVYLMRPFNSVLSNKSSSAYMSLAIETYYLLMEAVRSSPESKLASIVADFYDIEFISDAGGANTKMLGKLAVRNDSACKESCSSSTFLSDQLKITLRGYRVSIANLNVTSPLDLTLSPSVSSISVLIIVIIALAVIGFNIALSIGFGVILCRLKRIKKAMTEGGTPVCEQNDQSPDSSDVHDYMAPRDMTPNLAVEFGNTNEDAYDYIGTR